MNNEMTFMDWLQILLIAFKLAGIIDASWLIVLFPLWVELLLVTIEVLLNNEEKM